MWKIGDLEICSRVVLGPMAGITSLSYREFCKPFGVGLSYTEMVSDCGLSYGNIKTIDYIKTSKIDHPVGIQLFGSNIDITLDAIKIIEESGTPYDVLDINLGCPVGKVTRSGAGSAWLKNPNQLFTYMSKICESSQKPVTAKIRLGWDENNINVYEIVQLLEKAGVKAITIHARTTSQMYTGKARFEIIKDIGKTMRVPLIVSGDIFSLSDAMNAIDITGATAVMVARGGVGNPTLILQINEYLSNNRIISNSSLIEQCEYLEKYSKMIINEKGEYQAIKILRGIAPKFFLNYPNTKAFRVKLAQMINSKEDLFNIIKEIKSIDKNQTFY